MSWEDSRDFIEKKPVMLRSVIILPCQPTYYTVFLNVVGSAENVKLIPHWSSEIYKFRLGCVYCM